MELNEKILEELGFIDNELETEHHTVFIIYYDIWRLLIQGKPKHTGDEIYIEDYFSVEKFIEIIKVITGKELNRWKN